MARNDHLPPPRRRQLFWLRRPFRGELPRDPRRPGNRPGDSPAGVAGRPRGITRRIRREISPGRPAGEFPAISDARPGNPPSYSPAAHPKSREIHRGARGGGGWRGPGNALPGGISREIHRRPRRISSAGMAYFESRGGFAEKRRFRAIFQNNMISATLPGEGAASVPLSAELPGQ